MNNESLLQRIARETPEMAAAEARVARFVSTHPNQVLKLSMARLAAKCEVSDPTILRFCRRFGFAGYQDFKLYLAQSLVPSAPFAYEQIVAGDSIDNIVRKTARNSLNAIQRGLEDIVPAQVQTAAEILSRARWTGLYATGISATTAFDAEYKFRRLGVRCAALYAHQEQRMHAESARRGEVALIFSQSGHTRQLVEIATMTRAGDAQVVSITAADSPLAEVSDALIAVTPYRRTELMTPLASRLNHHLVVNMLVTSMAMISDSEFPDQLPALDSWQTDKI